MLSVDWWWSLAEYVILPATVLCLAATVVGIVLVARARNANVRKLGLRVFWATAAAFVAALMRLASTPVAGGWSSVLADHALSVAVLLPVWALHYWCIPFVIRWRYQDDHRRRWHVWAAWVCTTLASLGEMLIHQKELAFIMLGVFIWAQPLAALIGVMIGEAGFRLGPSSSLAAVSGSGQPNPAARHAWILIPVLTIVPMLVIERIVFAR